MELQPQRRGDQRHEDRAEIGQAYFTERMIGEEIRSAQNLSAGAASERSAPVGGGKRHASGSASSSQAKSARGDDMDRTMRPTTSSATASRAGSRLGAAVPPRPQLQSTDSARDYVSSRPSSDSGTAMSYSARGLVPMGRTQWADETEESRVGSRRSSRASSSAAGAAVTSSASARGGPTAPRRGQDRDPLGLSGASRSEPERDDRNAGPRDRDRDRRDDRRREGERRDRDRDRDRRGDDSRRSSTEQGRYRSER